MVRFGFLPVLLLSAVFPSSAIAGSELQFVISNVEAEDAPVITLLLVNNGQEQAIADLPDRIEGEVGGSASEKIQLERVADTADSLFVPAHGFALVRYRTASPIKRRNGSFISIPQWRTQEVALASSSATPTALPAAAVDPARLTRQPDRSPQSQNESAINAFINDFSSYEPIYLVFGKVKHSERRVQFSFKYRLIGGAKPQDDMFPSWRDGLYAGFTQRMFWDIASDAFFRDINYLPEIFYRTRSIALDKTVQLGVQIGFQHESNGRARALGRSLNNIYIAPTVRFDLGGGYSMSFSPRLLHLVAGRSGNPDILDYRGNTSLNAQIGKDDGLRLATYTRFNMSNGHGSFQSELSYPLPKLLGGGPNLYLFGQAFTGYGESLLDYNRRMQRLRIGVALTR